MTTATAQTQTTGKYADVNGIKMYYEMHGAGHPLVLIHGGGSTINSNFGRILPILAKTHRVIAVEMQAHGRTSDRGVPETFIQDADDIAELLKQLKIDKADILGFSNGGQTCFEIALRHPAIVNKLIIASAFYKRSAVFAGFWDGFKHAKISDMPQVYHEEFLKVNNNPAALQTMFNRDVERMSNFKDWTDGEIQSIKFPTLIVTGDQDLPPAEHAVEMHRLMPNSRLAIVPGTHGSYMGEAITPDTGSKVPALFVELVNEFLGE